MMTTLSSESVTLLRKYRSLGVVWAIFSLCYNIIVWVVVIQDEWIGDGVSDSLGQVSGNFGLYSWCIGSECGGGVTKVSDISVEATISTVFAGLSLLASCLSVLTTVLFCKYSSSGVYKVCGSLQILSGLLLVVTSCVFPVSWTQDHVQTVCGDQVGLYSLGNCEIRWVYILAVIAALDGLILGSLALSLALSEDKVREKYFEELGPEPGYPDNDNYPAVYTGYSGYPSGSLHGSQYGGHTNLGFSSDTLSSVYKSQHLYMSPHGEDDRYSAYSQMTERGSQARHNYYNLVL